jgi:hypothetical protein
MSTGYQQELPCARVRWRCFDIQLAAIRECRQLNHSARKPYPHRNHPHPKQNTAFPPKNPLPMPHHWLMKSEPSEASVDDALAAPNATVSWTGVRNY